MSSGDEPKQCPSRERWWPKIKDLAEKFEEALNKKWNKNSVFFQLNQEKLNSAFDMYEKSWWRFKEHVYGKIAEKKRIDRHKVASLYILSFLIKRPFEARPSDARASYSNKADEDRSFLLDPENRRLLLANELFSYVILRDILFSWDKKKDEPFDMDENRKAWFMILLNSYSFKLEPESNSQVMSDESLFLSLAQIIYYIEKLYI